MKPCFLFWKNAAKQMTPAPPATVAMTDAAMLPLLNGLPSNCAGRGGRGACARGGSFTVERRSRRWRCGAWTVSDLVRVDASGSTQRSASKMTSPARRLKAGARQSTDAARYGTSAHCPPAGRRDARGDESKRSDGGHRCCWSLLSFSSSPGGPWRRCISPACSRLVCLLVSLGR